MSLEILSENWDGICKKIIQPLWKSKFANMYQSVKLDESDFFSMAGEELTKAFLVYDSEKSNVFTYASHILKRKAMSELRNKTREKRLAETYAESLYGDNNDNSDNALMLVNNIVDTEAINDEKNIEVDFAVQQILKLLKNRERKIIQLIMADVSYNEIADRLHIKVKDIIALQTKLKNNSEVRKLVRKLGYLGGLENEV